MAVAHTSSKGDNLGLDVVLDNLHTGLVPKEQRLGEEASLNFSEKSLHQSDYLLASSPMPLGLP